MDEAIKKPDFFLIGAPKCGTSALSVYLGEHPDVFFSKPKEPHYFSKDFSYQGKHNNYRNEEEYLLLFRGAGGYRRVGEGSTRYLYSRVAIENILEFRPDARFIVMLRDPIDMLCSLHAHLLHLGEENVESLEKAWSIQKERTKGRKIPEGCRDRESLFYGAIGSLGEQLERVVQQVPEEHLLMIFFEDFRQDPLTIYKAVLNFLGLPDDERETFQVVNARKGPQPSWAHSLYHPPKWMVEGNQALKRLLGLRKVGLLPQLRKSLERKRGSGKETLSEPFIVELREYFQEDVRKLSEITGKDLSHWLK